MEIILGLVYPYLIVTVNHKNSNSYKNEIFLLDSMKLKITINSKNVSIRKLN